MCMPTWICAKTVEMVKIGPNGESRLKTVEMVKIGHGKCRTQLSQIQDSTSSSSSRSNLKHTGIGRAIGLQAPFAHPISIGTK